VETERALETQRAKLLRLLAGWLALVGLMSGGPLRIEVPRWLRVFLVSLVTRAELAAQSLVVVAACVAARNGGRALELHPASLPFKRLVSPVDDVPSTQELLRRMTALRALLENLPRHGMRLLRRARQKTGRSMWWIVCEAAISPHLVLADSRIERPPDKSVRAFRPLCV